MKFFSKTTVGFYDSHIHSEMPEDAIKITDTKYNDLIKGQSLGQIISADKDGNPTLIDQKFMPEEIERKRINTISQETKSRIIALFPGATYANYLEKQMNAMMRGIRINNIAKGSQTAAQKAEASALIDIADKVDTIRATGQSAEEDGTLLEDILWPA